MSFMFEFIAVSFLYLTVIEHIIYLMKYGIIKADFLFNIYISINFRINKFKVHYSGVAGSHTLSLVLITE